MAPPLEKRTFDPLPGEPPLDAADQAWLDSFIAVAEEHEQKYPGSVMRACAVRGIYGEDFDRELADLEAGRHPYQLPR